MPYTDPGMGPGIWQGGAGPVFFNVRCSGAIRAHFMIIEMISLTLAAGEEPQ